MRRVEPETSLIAGIEKERPFGFPLSAVGFAGEQQPPLLSEDGAHWLSDGISEHRPYCDMCQKLGGRTQKRPKQEG